ncbi:MAG: hypothetical protein KKI02_05945, partial [Planctomycetes bacterium]|nr:hypothetical protein [Planctomycetota bacterium]
MLKKLCATVAVLSFAAVALAGGTVSLVNVPYVAPGTDLAYPIATYESEGWCTFDLVVTVDNGDAWTVAYADAVTVGTFFQHPMGGNTQPDPAQFAYFGLVQYDSFWTTPEEWPNPNVDPALNATVFAPGSPLTL